jgi:Uma2 family endonuclease
MAAHQRQSYISPEEYLENQRHALTPSEYMDGEMIAMASGSKAHGQITAAIMSRVYMALVGKPCEASTTTAVAAPSSYLIPDIVVYCDGGDFTPDDEVLRNPVVIFEVLSTSTEGYDHGQKWMRYQQIGSLMHYVLISQSSATVELFTRETAGGWHYQVVSGADGTLNLSHLDINVSLSDIYERVVFSLA